MTRIFTEGAEMNDMLFFDENYSSSDVISSTKRSGEYAYHIGAAGYLAKYFSPALSECYFRQGFYFPSRYEDRHFCTFRYNGTNLLRLTHDAVGHWVVRNDSSVLEDSGVLSSTSGWVLIEIHYLVDNSNGIFTVKIDGVQIINYIGDTQPSTESTFNNIYWAGGYGGAINENLYFDDFALNDTNGVADNSWCGDGCIIKITPSGSSATTNDWLNSGSVSGSANYLYVDEYPSDGDTTYVYASGSDVGLQTQFAMSNETFTGKTILRIYPEARARKTTGELDTIKIGFLADGGTDVMSGSANLSIGAYTRIVGDETKVNPVTSASWTENDINSLEFVAEVGSSG